MCRPVGAHLLRHIRRSAARASTDRGQRADVEIPSDDDVTMTQRTLLTLILPAKFAPTEQLLPAVNHRP